MPATSDTTPPSGPYKGLTPYTEDDAVFFFGREREQEIITANLMASRLTVLYGMSGVGKSSVLRAGVAHHMSELARRNLKQRGKPKLAVVYFNTWRDDPFSGLSNRVQEAVWETLEEDADGHTPVPSLSLARTLQSCVERVDGTLFIILDQFEEYFLYHARTDERGARFATEFSQAVNQPDLRANFLISITDEALAKLDRFKGLIPNLFDNSLRIEHLKRESARTAIEAPIEEYDRLYRTEATRIDIEPALVDGVLNQVRTGQVILGRAGRGTIAETVSTSADELIETPYLQLVMERLWQEEKRSGAFTLRLSTLTFLGGAERIVRAHLGAAMHTFKPEDQEIASRAFHYLVTPSGTKIAHTVSDLAKYALVSPEELAPILTRLSSGQVRILRQVDPPINWPDEPRYEIFHDVIVPAILDWQASRASTRQRPQEWIQTLPVGPSRDRATWWAALTERNQSLLADLVERELPAVALFEIATFINGMYRDAELSRQGQPGDAPLPDIKWVLPTVDAIRRQLGWRQREFDINMLRWVRRSSALSMVIGAGVTMEAGGPSWRQVVRHLLKLAIEKGREVTRITATPTYVPEPGSLPDPAVEDSAPWTYKREVVHVERFTKEAEAEARHLLSLMDAELADAELLMRGAQLCHDLFREQLFIHLADIIYSTAPHPGEIHRAIAELAHGQHVPAGGQNTFSGWNAIITHNFDALMEEALADEGVPHSTWVMRNRKLAGAPDDLAKTSDWYQPVLHFYGCLPRKRFVIDQVDFVFTTSQYKQVYGGMSQGIVETAMSRFLAPGYFALHVGYSFADEGMNDLLRDAAKRYPGRLHYALVKWPTDRRGIEPTADELEANSRRYLEIGVQPIWFDDYAEVPAIIRSLK